MGICDDLVSPAESWVSSRAMPRRRWGGGQNVDGFGAGSRRHNFRRHLGAVSGLYSLEVVFMCG